MFMPNLTDPTQVTTGVGGTGGPTPGKFYKRGKTSAVNMSEIARVAGKNANPSISTLAMLKIICASAWNKQNFTYTKKGYEVYPFEGPSYHRGFMGSSSEWPLLWIPTLSGEEPEEVFGDTDVPPGGGQSQYTPPTQSRTPYKGGTGLPSTDYEETDPGDLSVSGGSSTMRYVGIGAIVLLGGGLVYWLMKKKKKKS